MKKIDCHTHIISKEVRDEYFAKTDNYAIVMQFPDSIMKNPECVETVRSDPRLFLCPAVDMKAPADSQVKALRAMIADPENKIVGLKIYTSYQRGAADDEKLFPEERNPGSFDEAVGQLKSYIVERGAWMDRNIENLRQLSHESVNKKYNH